MNFKFKRVKGFAFALINEKSIPGIKLSVLIVIYNKVTKSKNSLKVNNDTNLKLI